MTLALKAHHVREGFLLATTVGLLTFVLAGHVVTLPQLLEGLTQPVNVGLVLAVGFAPITAYVCSGESLLLESRAQRGLVVVDAVLVLALVLPVLAFAVAAQVTGDTVTGLGVIRNSCAFIALTLFLLAIAKPATAAGLAVVYFLVIGTLGLRSDGSTRWWAWLRAEPDARSVVVALALLIIGATAFHLRARRRTAALSPLPEETV